MHHAAGFPIGRPFDPFCTGLYTRRMLARTVSFTDFRKNASSILDEVENGAVYRIVRHGRVIAELTAPEPVPSEATWKTRGLRLVTKGGSLSDAILEDRTTPR